MSAESFQTALQAAINEVLTQGAPARVFPVFVHGEKLWVKQAAPARITIWHRLQGRVSRLLNMPILAPTFSPGGQQGLAREAERSRSLRARGVRTPVLRAESPGWLVYGDGGMTLSDRLAQGDGAEILIEAAAAALAQLHGLGEAHGAAQIRNLMVEPDGAIGFIDLEEQPGESMPLAEAQARDLFLFLFSVVPLAKRRPDLPRLALAAYRAQAPAQAMAAFAKIMRPVRAISRPLQPFRRKLGRDLRRVLTLGELADQASE